MMHRPTPLVIAIEACMGSGKGFFLKYLARHGWPGFKIKVLTQEDSIEHVMDCNNDPHRWFLVKELHFLCRHVRLIGDALRQCIDQDEATIILVEGSPTSDLACYFNPFKKLAEEQALYEEWYETLRSAWRVDAHVFLSDDVHHRLERVTNNCKKEQAQVGMYQLSQMTSWYWDLCKTLPPDKVHVLPCEQNFEDNEPVLRAMSDRMQQFVRNMCLKANDAYAGKKSSPSHVQVHEHRP